MRQLILFFSLLFFIFSCNTPQPPTETASNRNKYPDALQKIFAHHGGLDQWNKMKSMSYGIVRDNGNEKQMIDSCYAKND